jgi:hypothetical protein
LTVTPEAAATLASEFLGREDAFSVQLTDYKGAPAYMVTFSSGDVVYVALDGQVLGYVPAVVQMANADPDAEDRESRNDGSGEDHEDDSHSEVHEEDHADEPEVEVRVRDGAEG